MRVRPLACLAVVAAIAASGSAFADEPPVPTPMAGPVEAPPPPLPSAPPRPAGQGVAVVGLDAPRDAVNDVARAVYASRLRPANVDEKRARVLAGDPVPPDATKETRDLAELRAGVHGEDVASRKLLSAIAAELSVQALVVVRVDAPPPPADVDAGEAPGKPAGSIVVKLFLADSGEFDAARYAPEPAAEGANAWRSTVASLERRFVVAAPPAAMQPAPPPRPQEGESRPFYASPWFWGAIGAAVLVGGGFYLASRDTSSDPIHLQMQLPR